MRLIDGDALAKRVHDNIPPVTDKVNYLASWHLIDAIDNAPTIEAKSVKHGRWIPLVYDGYADGYPVWDLWECSECQEEHSGEEDTLTNCCPNCGAKMDLEET